MKFILMTFLFVVSNKVLAYNVAVGTHTAYFKKSQVDNAGSTNTFDFNPYIGLGAQYHIYGYQYFVPEIGYSLYILDTDDNARKEIVFLNYNFAWTFESSFIFRYGLTTYWDRQTGKGGSSTLRNGNGRTSFPNPNKTVTSYYTTVNLGAEYFWDTKDRSLRFDFHIMNARDWENRAYNYLLGVNFYL